MSKPKQDRLARVKRGQKPTLADATKANEVIAWANSLRHGMWLIAPVGTGQVMVADNGVIIDLAAFLQRFNAVIEFFKTPQIQKTVSVPIGGSVVVSFL